MKNKKLCCFISLLVFCGLLFSSFMVSAATVLKKGMRSDEVKALQVDLIELGMLDANATGYYGELTYSAVKELQKKFGYVQDGIAGSATLTLIKRCLTADTVSQSGTLLKLGMSGSGVSTLQIDLKTLGFFSGNTTGYYGTVTRQSVMNLQKKYGYTADGIAGKNTFALIDRLLGRKAETVSRSSAPAVASAPEAASAPTAASTASSGQGEYMMKWFGGVENILKREMEATVYDIDTGKSFRIQRSFGTNHADCEALTAEDAAIMKEIYGGEWSWARRAIIVDVGGTKFAASMNGMPHAGLDKYEALATVNGRAGDYGRGTNYDAVKGNDMDGHFCIHFYQSRTHGTNKVDSKHQEMVKKAADWAEKNY